MNIKERALAAVNFSGVDRIPTTYRGIDYLTESLFKYLGLGSFDNIQKKYKDFLNELGADFWSSGQCPGAFSYFNPECNHPVPELPLINDSAYFYTLGIKSRLKLIEKYNYNTIVWWDDPPLANIESENEISEGFLTSKLDYFEFDKFVNKLSVDSKKRILNKKINARHLNYENLRNSQEDFICMGTLNEPFIICSYLRGMEQFLMDMVSNTRLAGRIIAEVSDFCIEFNKRELGGFGDKAEWYSMWDDVASQDGLLFDPRLFKKYFLPIYKELIGNSKKYGLVFSWHCCGNVNDILSLMIDAGIDVFEVVQTSARDMGIEEIFRKYSGDICLHGGIDVQKLLISGTPEDVRDEVKKIIDLWGDNGGIILAPSHEALPETPVENIAAIYKTVAEEMG